MNQRILIICPLLPRLPIRFVSFGLSLRDERIRKKFSYIPLALFFRRAREHAVEVIHPTRYASQDGTNITVAPRFEFTIYLTSNLKSLPDYKQILGQQNWNESNNVSTIMSPLIARNFQVLAKSYEPQSDHVKRPFTWGLHRKNHLFGAASAANYSVLALKPDFLSSAINKVVRQTATLLAQQNIGKIDEVYSREDSHSRNFFATQISASKNRKHLLPISEFHQASQFVTEETNFEKKMYRKNRPLEAASTADYSILALKPDFLSSAINKVVRQTTTLLAQQNIGKIDEVYSREDSHSRNFFATQISASKNRKHLPPISEFHQASQFVMEETNFEKKMHRKNRPLEAASTANYPILAFKPQFLSGAIRKVFRQDITLSSRQNIRKGNMIYPKADFPLPGMQQVRQLELGVFQEKLISPTSLDYRTEKKIQSVSIATVTESTPLPVSTPKIDIDRLSRDVWNKIEKLIRIERERHGR